MEVRSVVIGSILIILLLVIILSVSRIKYSQFVVVARNDGASKHIAIQNIEIIDTNNKRQDIIYIDGKNILTSGFSSAAGALDQAAGYPGDVSLNGKHLGYVKDAGTAGIGTAIGPLITFLPSANASNGYIIFALGCPTKIAYINIKPAEDDISRSNMQYIKIYLLDKYRLPVKGYEYIIPTSPSIIPQINYHISFVQ